MADIAPELLEKIRADFESKFSASKLAKKIQKKILNSTATYADTLEYAAEIGEILSKVLTSHLSSETLPNGRLYYNIAERILRPMLEESYALTADVACEVQQIINRKMEVGIKAARPGVNKDRIDGIINITSGKDVFDDIAYMLKEPLVNFTQAVVDDTVKVNAELHYNAGLEPVIKRTARASACDWCKRLAGVYDYSDVKAAGNPVFMRHRDCRCLVEYDPRNGKLQNVHTKKWSDDEAAQRRIRESQIRAEEYAKSEAEKKLRRQKLNL